MTVTVMVCAHNEEAFVAACLHSLLAQTRIPDEILVINNASTDRTGDVARAVPGVRVVDLLVYLDADCRAPISWLERIVGRFTRQPSLVALSGNYRFYDWDWWGRTLLRAYDFTLGPGTQFLVKYVLRLGVVFYGGNFADPLDRTTFAASIAVVLLLAGLSALLPALRAGRVDPAEALKVE